MNKQEAFEKYKKLVDEEKELVVAGFNMLPGDPKRTDILHRVQQIWADKKRLTDEIWSEKED